MVTTTEIQEISPEKAEAIIVALIRKCNSDIEQHQRNFTEMEENGDAVTGFIASFITDEEDKIKGLEFCRGKTIAELKAYIAQPLLAENPANKNITDINAYSTAIVRDPAYRNRKFRRGIEMFLENAEKKKK